MSGGSLPSGTGLVSGALDVATMKPATDALNAANRGINMVIDYSIGMTTLMLYCIAVTFFALLLLGIIRSQNRRADARERAAEERYKMDAARQERDIVSRDNLAKALQELSIFIRTSKCIVPQTTTQPDTQKLLPSPEHS